MNSTKCVWQGRPGRFARGEGAEKGEMVEKGEGGLDLVICLGALEFLVTPLTACGQAQQLLQQLAVAAGM